MPRRIASVACVALFVACTETPTAPSASDAEAGAGAWRPWVLASASELRPPAPAPAGSAEAASELDAVMRAQAAGGVSAATIARWSGSPSAVWDSTALRLLDFYFPLLPEVRLATPARAARVMALLHVAVYDALLATWDAKYTYRRTSPAGTDPRVRALIDVQGVPSYPSEHAAAAEAAAAVLADLFPAEDTLLFHAMAREAGEARIAAGAAYPGDVSAGAAIGRAVAARVIARAHADGAMQPWTGAVPTGLGLWQPTPNKYVRVPFDALAGSWRTWVIVSGDAYRPPPPPAPGSPGFQRDLAELRSLSTSRTVAQINLARYWATDAPSVIWEKYLQSEIVARRMGPVRAARAQALASVAMYDAFVACWDAKFYYWVARPVTADTIIRTVFPTPPFPSYPSGHSTISSAAGEVFAELFPDSAAAYRQRGVDASLSRVYAAVHYRFDVDAGDSLGVRVGQAVVAHARADGAR
ncbi:MAG: phosphatase PAP2 family protein [Gemmatimonadaceae bacterium]|nr:phosphatase PAP2 family protein [Gemmatimonadaceae bacterium]